MIAPLPPLINLLLSGLAGWLMSLQRGRVHVFDSDERQAFSLRFSIGARHIVDQRLRKSRGIALGVHMLDVPKLVRIVLDKVGCWRTTVNGQHGQTGFLGRSESRVANGAICLGNILHNSTCTVTREIGRAAD